MERFKDFIYDISDLLISLLIIAAIFAVISWKLTETIPIEAEESLPTPTASAPAEKPSDTVTPPESDTTTPSAATGAVTDASDADKPIEQPVDAAAPPAQAPVQPPAQAPPAAATGAEVTITIPDGSPGVAIGKLLKDNGLITDVSAFIKKVDELGLGPKLRSGTFKLKSGMSLEQIIKVLANVK